MKALKFFLRKKQMKRIAAVQKFQTTIWKVTKVTKKIL